MQTVRITMQIYADNGDVKRGITVKNFYTTDYLNA